MEGLFAITLDTDTRPCKSSELDTENLIFLNFYIFISYFRIGKILFMTHKCNNFLAYILVYFTIYFE